MFPGMTLFDKPTGSKIVPILIPQISMSMPDSGFIYDIVADDSVRKCKFLTPVPFD